MRSYLMDPLKGTPINEPVKKDELHAWDVDVLGFPILIILK